MKIKYEIEIESSIEKIFKILADGLNAPKWNLVIDKIDQFESAVESPYYFAKTAVGNVKIIETELIKNESIFWHMIESSVNSLGYILSQKGDYVEIVVSADFDDPKNEALFRKTLELMMVGLRSYVNYLEEGGNPDEYDKSSVLISAI